MTDKDTVTERLERCEFVPLDELLEHVAGLNVADTIKHGRKQYDQVNYPTASVHLPEAFYTIAELNELIATMEQRNTVVNLALARSMVDGFGRSYPKKEGCAVHPDDPINGAMSDTLYIKQAKAYLADSGETLEDAAFSRKDLLAKINDARA